MRRSWTLGGSAAGLAIMASATVGVGLAEAAPAQPLLCSTLSVVSMTQSQKEQCGLVGAVASSAGSAVSGATGGSSPSSGSSGSRSSGTVGRTVQDLGDSVGSLTGRSSTPSRASTPTRSNTSGGSSATTRRAAPARAVAPAAPAPAAAPITAAPVAAAPDYGMLMSSSYDKVPTSLLGTAAPAGGAGASLISPASYDPGLLLAGTPGRTLAPAGAADGVTTTSSASPVLADTSTRLGTPLLLGVLAVSTVIALAVRSSVLRRSRRTA